MLSMAINMQRIFYALYQGKTDIRDERGNLTGETELSYSTPVFYYINVSAARGTAEVEQFGINANYTKTMVTTDMNCPITETSRLWVGCKPTKIVDGQEVAVPHNYVVVSVAKSINSITYAIKEVSVT